MNSSRFIASTWPNNLPISSPLSNRRNVGVPPILYFSLKILRHASCSRYTFSFSTDAFAETCLTTSSCSSISESLCIHSTSAGFFFLRTFCLKPSGPTTQMRGLSIGKFFLKGWLSDFRSLNRVHPAFLLTLRMPQSLINKTICYGLNSC